MRSHRTASDAASDHTEATTAVQSSGCVSISRRGFHHLKLTGEATCRDIMRIQELGYSEQKNPFKRQR